LLEAWLVIEAVAPARLHVERFLPQSPLRVLVDHTGADHSDRTAFTKPLLRKGDAARLMQNEKVKRQFLPAMLEHTRTLGKQKSHAIIATALALMHAEMGAEITRLRDLAEVNDHIKPEEITALEARESELATVISHARVRLDAVRLIWKAPPN
jgi:ATP-dependent helicase HepA